jgi:hypothetical protein
MKFNTANNMPTALMLDNRVKKQVGPTKHENNQQI